ncbi:long-chain-fatty-acid--CoA ligase [Malassezia cuniculi]|uniref:Long-chain-fatty-acid--CoA ligase n=1 Tax=Malassezia cuniculi TaxID=948313 RepID=A0AAF0EVS8_9BASI|nr:long-chain-fatty-acid--CoA ligase [Malassezia cuniculi]
MSVELTPEAVSAKWAAHLKKQMITVPNSKKPGYTEVYRNALYPTIEVNEDTFGLIQQTFSQYANEKCLGHRPFDENKGDLANHFVWRTYKEVDLERTYIGSAISSWVENGLLDPKQGEGTTKPEKSGIAIAYWGPNRPEASVINMANLSFSRISISLYDNYDAAVSCFILQHSHVRVLFTSSHYVPIVLRAADKLPELKAIVLLDIPGPKSLPLFEIQRSELIREWAKSHDVNVFTWNEAIAVGQANPHPFIPPNRDTIESFCYTSGTTGLPKAVIIRHSNIAFGMAGLQHILPEKGLVSISYLPLAHILERGWESFILMTGGAVGYYSGKVDRLPEDLQILKPSAMPAVPRVLNRVAAQIETQLAAGGIRAALLSTAINTKIKNYDETGTITHAFWDRLVFRKVRAKLGGNLRVMVTGSAPCRKDVLRLLRIALVVDIREGYGQTENMAYATYMAPNDPHIGCVGPINPGLELRLRDCPELGYTSEDKPYPRGEVQIRGGSVFTGYYEDEKKTKETFDGDWLATGDVGQIDQYGRLQIVDRVKNLIKLAQGEYIAIERVEGIFASLPICQQVWLYGDSFQPHLVAVAVPDPPQFAPFASKVLGRHISDSDEAALESAANDPKVVEAVLQEFIRLGKSQKLGTLEQMRALKLRMDPFSPDNNMMTPTLKIKRQEAAKILRKDLDALYEQPPYDLSKVK